MKNIPQVSNEIRTAGAIQALPRLVADWNFNRYIDVTVSNVPDEDTDGFDIEHFPIESIVEPIRPTKGVAKAIVNQALVANNFEDRYRPRFYTASVDDKYKYWVSPYLSDGSGVINGVQPTVIYSENVETNKIVVNVENSWASPVTHYVEITTNGGSSWSTVASNPPINNKGQVIIYYNGAGWSSTRPSSLTATKIINGVRYRVMRLGAGRDGNNQITTYTINGNIFPTTGYYASFSLISLGAHYETDLTDRLISVDDTFDIAETSELYPVGTLTSNVGNVSLWNGDGLLNSSNSSSPIHKLLDANVEMNLEYIYDIDGIEYPVQQFKMYSENWAGQKTEKVAVSLSDASKFLKEVTPNPVMWEGRTVPEIVSMLCDSVGFVDYNIDQSDRVVELVIPIFWTDGEQSVWEVLDEVAKSTQTAIYFDSYGVLQVKSREDAFNDAATPVWTLRGETSGTELADIVSIEQASEMNPNHVTVVYQNTRWETYSDNQPALRVAWEPEGETEVLRASPLKRTISDTSTDFNIPAEDALLWPYSGIVNIEGELIRYEGKEYIYYTSNGNTRNSVYVKSQDEMEKYNKKTAPRYRYMNHYTGEMKITERGVWNSEAKIHDVEASGYSVRHLLNGNHSTNVYGFNHNRAQSKVTLNPGSAFSDYHDILWATRGSTVDSGFYSYGAMFNFVKSEGDVDQIAGILIHNNGSDEDGYYVEFKPSERIDAKLRANRHEVLLYSRKNGQHQRLGPEHGVAIALAEDVEYDVDLYITTDHEITLWVNGKRIITTSVPSGWRNARNGKFGLFAKGKTKVQFEYLYAIARDDKPADGADDSSFLDRVNGEYVGRQWDREWVYKWRALTRRQKKKSSKARRRWNQMFLDDFGPFVHEVREYNAVFEKAPVLASRIYLTNDWSAVCTEYTGDAFGAHFIVANASRKNAVVHGDDTVTYAGTDKEINQALTVIAQSLEISEGEEVVVKNENQIRRRGRIEVDLSSPWIQNKNMANAIADWVSNHWGDGTEQHEAEIFGNPLLEIGDVVSVEFPRKFMSAATHKFFVVGTSTSFDQGIKTTLTLRRVV